jgi:hypothetical protein
VEPEYIVTVQFTSSEGYDVDSYELCADQRAVVACLIEHSSEKCRVFRIAEEIK